MVTPPDSSRSQKAQTLAAARRSSNSRDRLRRRRAAKRVGRKIAGVDGFGYSDALKAYGEGKTWDDATLAASLANPKSVVAGTSMAFAGLKKEEDRKSPGAYLAQFDGTGASK